jgi:hypothetical protein
MVQQTLIPFLNRQQQDEIMARQSNRAQMCSDIMEARSGTKGTNLEAYTASTKVKSVVVQPKPSQRRLIAEEQRSDNDREEDRYRQRDCRD